MNYDNIYFLNNICMKVKKFKHINMKVRKTKHLYIVATYLNRI